MRLFNELYPGYYKVVGMLYRKSTKIVCDLIKHFQNFESL